MDNPLETIPAKKKSKKNNLIRSDDSTDIDRVGNLTQKELALSAEGVTRRKVYGEIKNLLSAVKVIEKMVDGSVVTNEEPDLAMRAKGVELALKAFGDLKEFERMSGNTASKVVYQWNIINNNSGVIPTRDTVRAIDAEG